MKASTSALRSQRKDNKLFGAAMPLYAPIAQWIEQFRPKEEIYVRIVVGAPELVLQNY